MSRFDDIVKNNLQILAEANPMPPSPPPAAGGDPAAGSALPAPPGGMPPIGGPGGDAGAGGAGEDMDDDSKISADPNQFTKSVLEKLTKVSPEMFENYLNTFSSNFAKIKDKEQFKQYYKTFYNEMKHVFMIQGHLKGLFKQLQGDVGQLLGGSEEPNTAKGGTGEAGPSGPGVE